MSIAKMKERDREIQEKLAKGESIDNYKQDKNPAALLERAANNKKLKKVLLKNLEQNKNQFKKARGKNVDFDENLFYE